MIFASFFIYSCESELQEQCYKTMSVSGGTTLMKGFTDRLEQELRADDRRFKNIVAPENRHISTWLGGSVMASLPTFQEMVVTVDEYAEAGARVVHSKCFWMFKYSSLLFVLSIFILFKARFCSSFVLTFSFASRLDFYFAVLFTMIAFPLNFLIQPSCLCLVYFNFRWSFPF